MICIIRCTLVVSLIVIVNGVHFLGGTITWHPLNISATGTPVAIVITQTYSWTYSLITCTSSMIAGSQLIPLGGYTNLATETLDCITNCVNGSLGYVAPTIVPRCTDISAPIGTTVGQRSDTVYLEVGDDFSAAFQLSGWRPLTTNPGSAPWSISTHIIVKTRSDNGLYNSAPVATMMSPISIPVNISTVINVPVADADRDLIRCRWAANGTAGADECGGVCPPGSLPPNTIIYPNCTIVITGPNISDWFAVALMVEDFIGISSTTPLSSVPVQFLVYVVAPPICTTPPEIVGKPTEQSCTTVVVGETYTSQLIANNYCGENVTIVDIATLSFPGMVKGNITKLDIATYYITLSWTPTTAQIGYQVMCAMAFDSENSQSAQYCFKYYVSEIDLCNCPGEVCMTTTTVNTKQTSDSLDWPFIGTVIGLALLGAVTLCCCICCRYCRLFAGYSDEYKHNGPCEFYHIERCIDEDCPWQKMPSSSSILSSRLISSKNTVYVTNSSILSSSTIPNKLSNSADGNNYLMMAHSQNRNYLLTTGNRSRTKPIANAPIFNVKVDHAIENEVNSDINPSTLRLNMDNNRKVSRMKSIAMKTNSNFNDELSEQPMRKLFQKIKAKHRGNEDTHGVRVIHLQSKLPIDTHQPLINNTCPIVIEKTIHSYHHDTNQTSRMRKGRSLMKHVRLADQQMATHGDDSQQIETIELTSLNSTWKSLNAIADARNISPSKVHIKHIHTEKKKEKSKESTDPIQSVVEKKPEITKHSKHLKTPVQPIAIVKHIPRHNAANQ